MAETSAASTSSGPATSANVPPSANATDTTVDAASSEATNPVDDPEEDWDGEKLKRSQVRDRLKRQKELERASHDRFQQAAKARKELEARESALKQALDSADWDRLMEARGLNPAEWAEQRLTKELQRQQMSPEQRENEALRQQLAQIQAQQQEQQKTTQQKQFEESKQRYFEHFDRVIAQAMTDFGKLPRTPTAVGKVADVLSEYLDDAGNLLIDPKIAAEIAYENSATDARQMAEAIADSKDPRAGEQLAEFLGAKVVAAIQKHVIAKSQAAPQKPRQQIDQPFKPKPKVIPTLEDARKQLGIR